MLCSYRLLQTRKMKLSLTSTWNTAGPFLLQATHALAAIQMPHFESCTPVKQDPQGLPFGTHFI